MPRNRRLQLRTSRNREADPASKQLQSRGAAEACRGDPSARSTAGGSGQLGAHRVGSVAPARWAGEEVPGGEGDPSRANGAAVELGTHRVQGQARAASGPGALVETDTTPSSRCIPAVVTESLQARLRRSGLTVPFQGPPCLRHPYAVHLPRQRVPPKTLGDSLGHNKPPTTP